MDGDIASVPVAFQWLLLGIPFPFVSASCFFDSAVYNLSGPLIMKAFGIFMFRSEKHLRHMETLDVVLCAEWMVTSHLLLLRFSGCWWESHFLLFLLVLFLC